MDAKKRQDQILAKMREALTQEEKLQLWDNYVAQKYIDDNPVVSNESLQDMFASYLQKNVVHVDKNNDE